MATKEQILEFLRSVKSELRLKYKVKEIGVFGSVARGEQNEFSDIDFLVEFEEGADLLHLSGLKIFLKEELNHEVDIVSKRVLRREFRDQVLKEFVQA